MPYDFSPPLAAGLALTLVLGLILAAHYVARRSGWARVRPATGRTLAVEDVLALDPRRRLHLVRCGERRVLLLTGGPQDCLVGWLPPVPGETRGSA